MDFYQMFALGSGSPAGPQMRAMIESNGRRRSRLRNDEPVLDLPSTERKSKRSKTRFKSPPVSVANRSSRYGQPILDLPSTLKPKKRRKALRRVTNSDDGSQPVLDLPSTLRRRGDR